jgi:hypothetical protein
MLAATGCMTSHITTTDRTAVEQALLSQAAEDTVDAFDFGGLEGKTYVVKTDQFKAVDGEYILNLLERKMLMAGMRRMPEPVGQKGAKGDSGKGGGESEETEPADGPPPAPAGPDLIVEPAVAHAAIDGTDFLIGVPSLPLALPGVGAVELPKIALFHFQSQIGRNRMSAMVRDARTGALVKAQPTLTGNRYYHRWTLLLFVNFRTTNLETPF